MSILTRIATLITANVNAMIDGAEDPEKMVDEYLRQMRAELTEAKAATAMAMADETRFRAQYERKKSEAEDWQHKAELAVQNDDDELAREALLRKSSAQRVADNYNAQWAAQHDQVEELRSSLAKLEAKINEAEAKREIIIAKQRRAQTQEVITESMQTIQGASSDNGLRRLEDKADDRLARADAMAQLSGEDLDNRFEELENRHQVETDLADLKRKLGKG